MNEEKLKRDLNKELCFDENMVGYKVMNNYIDKAIKIGKLEERERISFQVKRLMVDIEKHWDNVPNPKKSVLYGLKQLQKEIGGMK